jgi:hypothetical protein
MEQNDDINNVVSNINFEGLYLIHIRECVMTNSNIYKIGRSNNLANRIYQYPNSSIVYLLIECPDSKTHESELIKLFTSKYKLKKFYGNEYFEGELDIMKQDIISYVKTHYNVFRIVHNSFNIYRYTEEGIYVLPNDRAIKNITVKTVKTVNTDGNVSDVGDVGDVGDIGDVSNADVNADVNVGVAVDDRKCTTCSKVFNYPYQLEKHVSSIRKCKPKTNDNQCSYCKSSYSSKYNLERHYNTCKEKQLTIINNTQNNIPDILLQVINDYRNALLASNSNVTNLNNLLANYNPNN